MNLEYNLKLIGALTSKPYAFTARSWELERIDFIDFYDPLLSNISLDLRGLAVMRILPRINENLNEEWISDKIRFSYDGFRRQRLITPLFRSELGMYKEISWEESFFIFFFEYNLKNYDFVNEASIESIVGSFVDLESIVLYKDFLSSMPDSKVQISMQNKSFYDNYIYSNFSFNNLLKNIDKIDFCLLLGTNLRYENPIINLKILRNINKGLVLFSLFCTSNLKYKTYSFGNNIKNFFLFLEGRNPYSLVLSKSKNPLIVIGDSLRQRIDSKQIVRLINIVKNFKVYISSLFKNSTQMLFNDIGIDSFKNIKGKSNFLFLYNSDEIKVKKNMYDFIVYQGHHGDYGASISDLIMPSTFLIEKKGTFLNLEGNSLKYRFILKPASLVRTDWRLFRALSLYMKINLNTVINTFFDVIYRSLEIFPNYNKSIVNNLFGEIVKKGIYKTDFRINNVILFSFFIDYYSSDVVSRASRIMSVTAMRFKNNFLNF